MESHDNYPSVTAVEKPSDYMYAEVGSNLNQHTSQHTQNDYEHQPEQIVSVQTYDPNHDQRVRTQNPSRDLSSVLNSFDNRPRYDRLDVMDLSTRP